MWFFGFTTSANAQKRVSQLFGCLLKYGYRNFLLREWINFNYRIGKKSENIFISI